MVQLKVKRKYVKKFILVWYYGLSLDFKKSWFYLTYWTTKKKFHVVYVTDVNKALDLF